MDYVIGVDIGGTRTRTALADRNGHILKFIQFPSDVCGGPQPMVDAIVQYIEQVRGYLPDGGNLLGIGVAAPGPLDPEAGIVFAAPNLPGWCNVPLRSILMERTGLPVKIANDANAAALAEWMFGGGVGCNHMVYITVSTGIGAGVIVDGHLLLGRLGSGAELGHVVMDLDHRLSWEQLASGTALGAAAAAAMERNPDTLLHEMATPQTVTAAQVASAAHRGDHVAQQLMQREAEYLGLGFVNTLHLFSPEIILVGGSVITSNPFLLEEARKVVQERVIADVYRTVPIEVTKLGDTVGVLGAVALLLVGRR